MHELCIYKIKNNFPFIFLLPQKDTMFLRVQCNPFQEMTLAGFIVVACAVSITTVFLIFGSLILWVLYRLNPCRDLHQICRTCLAPKDPEPITTVAMATLLVFGALEIWDFHRASTYVSIFFPQVFNLALP